jgi:hypothetical protein
MLNTDARNEITAGLFGEVLQGLKAKTLIAQATFGQAHCLSCNKCYRRLPPHGQPLSRWSPLRSKNRSRLVTIGYAASRTPSLASHSDAVASGTWASLALAPAVRATKTARHEPGRCAQRRFGFMMAGVSYTLAEMLKDT